MLFIQRALAPAKVSTSAIRVDEENMKAEVLLRPEEMALAIGKDGYNIRLAIKLTGYDIEVFRDTVDAGEEDIYLDEFNDEIEDWVIEQLKEIGCNTAKDVLGRSNEELLEKTDLEESSIEEIKAILAAEFE